LKKALPLLLLVLTAAIWGFAFVAQRVGNRHLDPFLYNGLRFALGAVSVALVASLWKKGHTKLNRDILLLGLVLFTASSLQQIGLVWTSAGAGGFITGLYVVFVPLIGILRKQRLGSKLLIALPLSVAGLALMNDFTDLMISMGNGLVLLSAVFWAMHVQLIDKLRTRYDALDLATGQYTIAAAASLLIALGSLLLKDPHSLSSMSEALTKAGPAILYGGIFSVGIAFSLQTYAQKMVAPTAAAIILSSEGIFALIGGATILSEAIKTRTLVGAAMMLLAILISLELKPTKAELSPI